MNFIISYVGINRSVRVLVNNITFYASFTWVVKCRALTD
jgi:hypothetical protein